jgi:hypothetical protein
MERYWHLVVSVCFFIPLTTANAFAQLAGSGAREYALLIPVCLLLGLACAALLNTMGRPAFAHITARPASSHSWYLGTFYVAVFAWMVSVGLFGILTASLISRFVS